MFFIVNLTEETYKEWEWKEWPQRSWFDGFAKTGDVVDLVEVRTEEKLYCQILPYHTQKVVHHSTEQLTKRGFTSARERAKRFISEIRKKKAWTKVACPRCEQCHQETLVPSDIHSILKTAKCNACLSS